MLLTLASVSALLYARENWPDLPPEDQARVNSYEAHEKELLAKLQPEIEEWGKKGKPYIPWASKPEDLPQAKIPAFPGAEGGGRFSFGGRGGKVYVETSLDDSGPGTLREACEAAGPRIVVFAVAGIIHLKMPIFIEAPYITIAGQTAPGDGICIADQGFDDNAHDVVIRYLRLRAVCRTSTSATASIPEAPSATSSSTTSRQAGAMTRTSTPTGTCTLRPEEGPHRNSPA